MSDERAVTRPGSSEDDARPVLLVADADAGTRQRIATVLADSYRIAFAEDGQVALDQVRRLVPEVVVCDWTLPKTGGEKLVQTLCGSSEPGDTIACLMLIATADAQVRARVLNSGAHDYLIKPFAPEELRARVQHLAAVRRAMDADRQKAEFLRLLSHELRTPLAAFRLQIEILARGLTEAMSPRQSAVVAKLARSNTRFVEVVELLSQYVRIDGGRVVPNATELDLSTVAASVAEEFRERAAAKTIAVRLDAPAGVLLASDPELVRLIVVCLCDDAIKRTSAGEIVVKVERAPEGGVRLGVRNGDGSGHSLGIALVRRVAAVLGAAVGFEGPERQTVTVTF